jgi:hypothetical protein
MQVYCIAAQEMLHCRARNIANCTKGARNTLKKCRFHREIGIFYFVSLFFSIFFA